MAYEYTTQGYTVNDSGRRLVVDPVTRIEGHLRCEVNINDDNVITNAVSCGTMFRGLEIIVKDRDPRDIWAFVERICGVCTGTRLASVHAIRDALKIDIPDNADIILLMQLALWYHDHLVCASTSSAGWTGSTWFPLPRPIPRKRPGLPKAFPVAAILSGLFRLRKGKAGPHHLHRSARHLLRTAIGGIPATSSRPRPTSCWWPTILRLSTSERHRPDPYRLRRQEPPPQLVGGRQCLWPSTSMARAGPTSSTWNA